MTALDLLTPWIAGLGGLIALWLCGLIVLQLVADRAVVHYRTVYVPVAWDDILPLAPVQRTPQLPAGRVMGQPL